MIAHYLERTDLEQNMLRYSITCTITVKIRIQHIINPKLEIFSQPT